MAHEELNKALDIRRQSMPAMRTGETSAMAVAAQSKALVEARYMMALERPRDMDVVRQLLVNECRRPGFANNPSTFYRKPIGKGVEGLGIRFVEAAMRCMRNVLTETPTVYEDAEKRVVRVCVTDLENNASFMKDVTVTKTVERSKPAEDGSYISVRKNSYGKDVFTVPAGDDDLLNKEGALISKAVRTLGLRIIPGDLQDEAEQIILATRRDEAARDPADARKRLVDAFATLGITAKQLIEYCGHSLDQTTPDEIVDLRGIYGSLREEETTWGAVMESRRKSREERSDSAPKAATKSKPDAAPKAAPTVDDSARTAGKAADDAEFDVE